MKLATILFSATLGFMSAAACWGQTPPTLPVRQNNGFKDIVPTAFTESDCRLCHNNNPPISQVDATYLPDRHHLLIGSPIPGNTDVWQLDGNQDGTADSVYDCLNCHGMIWTGTIWQMTSYRDCLACHTTTTHHRSVKATSGNCSSCHSDQVWRGLWDSTGDGYADWPPITTYPDDSDKRGMNWIPDHTINLFDPWPSGKNALGPPENADGTQRGNCNYCHDWGISPEGLLIGTNQTLHHETGLADPALNLCWWCHDPLPLDATTWIKDGESIRRCEVCHSPDSLHDIQVDTAADADLEGSKFTEDPYFGHSGSLEYDCAGCHGATSSYDLTVSRVPALNSLSPSAVWSEAGTLVTVLGNAFIDTVLNPDTGDYYLVKGNVQLVGASGAVVPLEPSSITQTKIQVTIPSTLAPGNYQLTIVKGEKHSNPMVLSVTPGPKILHVTRGADYSVLIGGRGFSTYLAASNSGTSVTGSVTKIVKGKVTTVTETATVSLWEDQWILCRFSNYPLDGTVKVNTVFSSLGSTAPSGGGKGGGKR